MRLVRPIFSLVFLGLGALHCGGGGDTSGDGDGDGDGAGASGGDGDLKDSGGGSGDGDGDGDGAMGGVNSGDGDTGGSTGTGAMKGTGGENAVPTFTIGGTVSASAPAGLTLALGDEEIVLGNDPKTFTFSTELLEGDAFDVRLVKNANNSRCALTDATGEVGSSDVSSVAITCSDIDYSQFFELLAQPVDADGNQVGEGTLPGMFQPTIASADVDQDGVADVVIGGYNEGASATQMLLYLSKGGFLVPVALPVDTGGAAGGEQPFPLFTGYPIISFGLANDDSYPDLLLSGQGELIPYYVHLYENKSGFFQEVLTPVDTNSDNTGDTALTPRNRFGRLGALRTDGPADIFLAGKTAGVMPNGQTDSLVSVGDLGWKVNNLLIDESGDGTATKALPNLNGWADFADLNGDGQNDIAMVGATPGGALGALYLSDGAAAYREVLTPVDTDMDGVGDGPLSSSAILQFFFADLNRDAYLDLIFMDKVFLGLDSGAFRQLALPFDTNGDGSGDAALTLYTGSGRMTVADIDHDGDADVVRVGHVGTPQKTELLVNNGDGSFVLASSGLTHMGSADVHFVDIDGDGNVDIVMSGNNTGASYIGQVYISNY